MAISAGLERRKDCTTPRGRRNFAPPRWCRSDHALDPVCIGVGPVALFSSTRVQGSQFPAVEEDGHYEIVDLLLFIPDSITRGGGQNARISVQGKSLYLGKFDVISVVPVAL